MRAFDIAYFILSFLLYLLALPLLVVYSFKKKYKESIPARFFLVRNSPLPAHDIWFHACSLGEVKALKPFIDAFDGKKVGITTITHTGYDIARKYGVEHRYLPYEVFLPFWIKKHKVLVVLEAEFWYMLFCVAASRGAKVVLLNARLSKKSFPKYYRFRWFYKKIFAHVDTIYCQSNDDLDRFIQLGAKHVKTVGNIKLLQEVNAAVTYEKPQEELIVAASTHEGEEEPIINAFLHYRKDNDAKLIVVPRHPERFDKVYELLKQSTLTVSRWSEAKHFNADIILIDAMGELNNIYAISDVAVLGGAFRTDVGGHNPLEPAHFGCKIITGKHFFNQVELFKYVHHVQYVESADIYSALYEAKNLPGSCMEERIDIDEVTEYLQKCAH